MQNNSLWGENMKIAEYRQVSTRTEHRVVHHEAEYDDNGNITAEAWDETVEAQVPVMGTVYRDATPEEVAEFERQQTELPEPEQSPEERLDALETTTDDMILLMAELIGGE